MFYYFIALFVVVIDQITKWIVATYMEIGQTVPIINGVFHLTSSRNRGAAFGILQGQLWLFIIVTVFVVGVIVYLLKSRHSKLFSVSLSFVLGGALGNFIDRAFKNGAVVDWLDFRWIHFPIFNLADTFLVIGVTLIILDSFKNSKQETTSYQKGEQSS